MGSYLGSAVPSRDIPKYAQLWRDGKLPVEELISDRIALADINRAMDQLADGHAIRQIIMFDAGEPARAARTRRRARLGHGRPARHAPGNPARKRGKTRSGLLASGLRECDNRASQCHH